MSAKNYTISILLALSGILLTLLIPGGSIENRDFSHIDPTILVSFNIFLTILGLGSFILAFYTLSRSRVSYWLALLSAISYFVVYAIDLYQIFPQSPTPMSSALLLIELLGVLVAIPLIYVTATMIFDDEERDSASSFFINQWWMLGLGILGTIIVLFATNAAMGG
ncbi:MAG TPA: hypothetical protein ENK66_07300 [Arcobacter sp.]|nr:hypothetical protein [Arcobacter sp.]